MLVDNTHSQTWEYRNYELLARAHGYGVQVVEIVCGTRALALHFCRRSVHAVPAHTALRMWDQWEHDPLAVSISSFLEELRDAGSRRVGRLCQGSNSVPDAWAECTRSRAGDKAGEPGGLAAEGGKSRGDAGRAARLRGRSGVMRGMTLRAVAARRKRIGSDPYSKGQVPARANATESSAAAGAAAHKSGHAPTSGIKLMFQKQGVNSPASRRGTHITVDTAHPGQGLVRSSPPSITLTRPPPRHLLLTSSRSALARKSTRALMYMHTSRSRFWYQPTLDGKTE